MVLSNKMVLILINSSKRTNKGTLEVNQEKVGFNTYLFFSIRTLLQVGNSLVHCQLLAKRLIDIRKALVYTGAFFMEKR